MKYCSWDLSPETTELVFGQELKRRKQDVGLVMCKKKLFL